MAKNELKARLAAGKANVCGWLAIPSAFSAEVMAQCGWNCITVDMQHGLQDFMSMVACFQGMQPHPVTPLVRVPWNEPGIIGKCLDGGAMGIICPMVNDAKEAKALVDACMYPPLGKRSNGPFRAGMYGEATGYQKTANDEILVIAMIETQAGIDNIDEILSVPGISGIYIGPSDMGLALGLIPTLDREEPIILDIYKKLVASCKKHGKFAGLHNATATYAARMVGMGFQLCTIANDSGLMARAARDAVGAFRKEAGDSAA
jgi:4-hydroxy-2-oxoheptanedioate aldolase